MHFRGDLTQRFAMVGVATSILSMFEATSRGPLQEWKFEPISVWSGSGVEVSAISALRSTAGVEVWGDFRSEWKRSGSFSRLNP